MKHVMGKLLGAFLGFLLAGADMAAWWGAIVGAIVCHPFDQFIRKEVSSYSAVKDYLPQGRRQEMFFAALFRSLGHVVYSDAAEFESREPFEVLISVLGLNDEQTERAKAHYDEGVHEGFDIVALMREFREKCGAHRGVYLAFFNALVDVACPHNIEGPARFVLKEMARQLRIPMLELDRIIRSKNSPAMPTDHALEGAWARLQIHPTEDLSEIKLAYRRQMGSFHPDRLMAKGVPPEVVELGKQQTQAIQEAYKAIMAKVDKSDTI